MLEGIKDVVETSIVLLFLREGEELFPQGYLAEDPGYARDEKLIHKVGQRLCGLAARDGQAVYSEDIHKDPRCTWNECKRAGLRSFAALPLLIQDRVIGVLGLGSATRRTFEKQSEFLETLASQAALSLQNALLFEEVQDYTDNLEQRVAERTAELEDSQKALLNVLEDVNKAKEALEKANEQLKDLDRLKSMFIATMSHELRTPLNSIIGFTGILLQGLAGDLNAEQKDQLQRVSSAGKHLLALITDIIDISKIEAGKADVHVNRFGLSDVIHEAAQNLQREIRNKGLDLEIDLPADASMDTDRRRLLQCVFNYLSNAAKFTEKGKIRIEAFENAGTVKIRVKDTGIGIKKEDMPRLFTSFVRLESPSKIPIPGTGLGLYLTKKIATEILGGSVSAESTYGVGSTFGIRVPKELR